MKEFDVGASRASSFWQKPLLSVGVAGLGIAGVLTSACDALSRGEHTEDAQVPSAVLLLPFPKGETWYFTSGPHGDSFSPDALYSVTFTSPEFKRCPDVSNRKVVAPADGTVILAGDPDKNSQNRNRVKIRHGDGLVTGYGRLDGIVVSVGQKVSAGDVLGSPGCTSEIGGDKPVAVGFQFFVQDNKGPVPITGFEFGGYRVVGGQPWGGLMSDGKIAAVASGFACVGPEIANPNTCGNTTNAVKAR